MLCEANQMWHHHDTQTGTTVCHLVNSLALAVSLYLPLSASLSVLANCLCNLLLIPPSQRATATQLWERLHRKVMGNLRQIVAKKKKKNKNEKKEADAFTERALLLIYLGPQMSSVWVHFPISFHFAAQRLSAP